MLILISNSIHQGDDEILGGGEYDSHDLQQFFLKNGIKHEKTPAYTLEMNGVAKRLNRTLTKTAKAILNEAKLN